MKLGACVAALGLLSAPVAQARTNCATAAEISAVQISAVQQELTDAALACGPVAVANFNRFQTGVRRGAAQGRRIDVAHVQAPAWHGPRQCRL